ncbi:hypothetical protein [Algoriphagus sp. PAP.12]|uniref:hypothetical protein n=1 Tax=Algoriphagus sp. PAP.12 TaxID=2996678 RepID=UPI00227A6106|nr:hypothetical protein [Algoriphagus sp. PAP.12]
MKDKTDKKNDFIVNQGIWQDEKAKNFTVEKLEGLKCDVTVKVRGQSMFDSLFSNL